MMTTTEQKKSTSSKKKKWSGLDLSDTPDLPAILSTKKHYMTCKNKKRKKERNDEYEKAIYVGVTCNRKPIQGKDNILLKKWRATITINKKGYHLGLFETQEEAGRIYAKALYKYKCKEYLRFTNNNNSEIQDDDDGQQQTAANNNDRKRKKSTDTVLKTEKQHDKGQKMSNINNNKRKKYDRLDSIDTIEFEPILKPKIHNYTNNDTTNNNYTKDRNNRKKNTPTSKYLGVAYMNYNNNNKKGYNLTKKWRAKITVNNIKHSLGVYETEEEAGRAYAKAAYKYRGIQEEVAVVPQMSGPTKVESILSKNFDVNKIPDQPLKMKPKRDDDDDSIIYQGVDRPKHRSTKYRARIRYNNERVTLGYFNTQKEAATMYAKAEYFLKLQKEKKQNKKQNNNNQKIIQRKKLIQPQQDMSISNNIDNNVKDTTINITAKASNDNNDDCNSNDDYNSNSSNDKKYIFLNIWPGDLTIVE